MVNQIEKLSMRPSQNKLPSINGHHSARSIGSNASLDDGIEIKKRITASKRALETLGKSETVAIQSRTLQ